MGDVDPIKERLFHPVIGPFIWAFLIVNFEIPVAILGAVARPDQAVLIISNWVPRHEFWAIVSYLLFPSFWIFIPPKLMTWWIGREQRIRLARENQRQEILGTAHIPIGLFLDSVERGRNLAKALGKVAFDLRRSVDDKNVNFQLAALISDLKGFGNGHVQAFGGRLQNISERIVRIGEEAGELSGQSDSFLIERAKKEGFVPTGALRDME